MAIDFSLGISWQFGVLAVASMLIFPFFKGRYAFVLAALGYSLVDVVPAIFGAPTIGLWTLTGALTWGLVGLLFTLQKPNGSPLTFAKLGIAGTLVFDAITGPILSPLLWGMSFEEALLGQIPFTAKHLFGITAVSVLAAPFVFPSVKKFLSRINSAALKPQISAG
ncbi:MAG: hypothetical protein N3G22_00560 [Candidatus Micrarchaeota archaeon]|nr:hypothetical protein [Candidatus Micrarchaeota archaeon]